MGSSQVSRRYDVPQSYESESRQSQESQVGGATGIRPTRPGLVAAPTRAQTTRAAQSAQTAHRPRPARQPRADIGLTASGAGGIAVLATGLAAIIDAAISPGLGWFFDFVFLGTSIVVAGRVCWRDSWAATMLPPLVFVAAAGIAAQVAPVTKGDWLDRTSADMLTAVVDGWVPLFLGVVLAAIIMIRRRTLR